MLPYREVISIGQLFYDKKKRKNIQIKEFDFSDHFWTEKSKSELIQSIIMGIPIQEIYMIQNKHGVIRPIDGKKRLSIISMFLNNKLCLTGCTLRKDLNGKTYRTLEKIDQARFEDFNLTFFIYPTNLESRIKKYLSRKYHQR